ncbi:MAG: hypothetical protein Q7T85_02485, partial [Nitrosomonas sp.]|nr:hypothetical protein [Nitrosomonas sp.]
MSAKDAASLEALIRPLPHYRRQSYITFDGRQAVEKGIWPVQVQTGLWLNYGLVHDCEGIYVLGDSFLDT